MLKGLYKVEFETPRGKAVGVIFANDGKLHGGDLPPLKWSSLKYVFRMEDKIDGKEEAYG